MRSPAREQRAIVERRHVARRGARRRSNTTSRSSVTARGGSPSPRRQLAPLRRGDPADRDRTRMLMISISGVEAVAVLGLVGAMEALRRRSSTQSSVDRAGGHVEAHLVALARVAAVGERRIRRRSSGTPSSSSCRQRLGAKLLVAAPAAARRRGSRSEWRSVATNSCCRSVASRPGGGDDARVGGHEHARDLQLERDVAGEQRPGAARSHEREVARVVPASDRVELDRLGHPELLDLQRAERGLLDGHHQLVGEVRMAASRRARDRAASRPPSRPRSGRRRPSSKLRVGRRRRCAAAPVARRARVGARRLRDRRGTPRPRRRRRSSRRRRRSCRCRPSAPSPGSRRPSCQAGDASERPTARRDADVRRRAADVERDRRCRSRTAPAAQMPPISPATGPDMSRFTGRWTGHLDRRHPARGLHQLHAVGRIPRPVIASSKRAT